MLTAKEIPVKRLELGVRAYALVRQAGITTLAELRGLSAGQIDEMCGIAKKAAKELKAVKRAPISLLVAA